MASEIAKNFIFKIVHTEFDRSWIRTTNMINVCTYRGGAVDRLASAISRSSKSRKNIDWGFKSKDCLMWKYYIIWSFIQFY